METPYGFCPICGSPGISRERSPFGNDRCEKGHVYKSTDSIEGEKELVKFLTDRMIIAMNFYLNITANKNLNVNEINLRNRISELYGEIKLHPSEIKKLTEKQ